MPWEPGGVSAAHFILFVEDQQRSRRFYEQVLDLAPRLDVPGMTEFELLDGAILGLMPEAGIERLLRPGLPALSPGRGVPRSELYLLVDQPEPFHARALDAGARELSGPLLRPWGHRVAYSLDPDSHLLAFAVVAEPE